MKVTVNTEACQGHSLCHINNPELFDLDEIDGFAIVRLPDGMVPPELEPAIRAAVSNCPERAISISD